MREGKGGWKVNEHEDVTRERNDEPTALSSTLSLCLELVNDGTWICKPASPLIGWHSLLYLCI